jgi:hypothetical protein
MINECSVHSHPQLPLFHFPTSLLDSPTPALVWPFEIRCHVHCHIQHDNRVLLDAVLDTHASNHFVADFNSRRRFGVPGNNPGFSTEEMRPFRPHHRINKLEHCVLIDAESHLELWVGVAKRLGCNCLDTPMAMVLGSMLLPAPSPSRGSPITNALGCSTASICTVVRAILLDGRSTYRHPCRRLVLWSPERLTLAQDTCFTWARKRADRANDSVWRSQAFGVYPRLLASLCRVMRRDRALEHIRQLLHSLPA